MLSHDDGRWLSREVEKWSNNSGEGLSIADALRLVTPEEAESLTASLFFEAMRSENWNLARECLSVCPHLIDPPSRDVGTEGPIHDILRAPKLSDASKLKAVLWLSTHEANLERRGFLDWTPLMLAVAWEKVEWVKAFLQAGANANAWTDIDGHGNSLMEAVRLGRQDLAELLLSHGATEFGDSLFLAAEIGNVDLIRLLLKAGASRFARNSRGVDAATIAEQAGHIEAARLLRPHERLLE